MRLKYSFSTMKLYNPNLPSSIIAVLGFLLLLLLPFNQLITRFKLGDFQTHHFGDILKNLAIICYGLLLIKRHGYVHISGVFSWFPRYPRLLVVPLYFVVLGFLVYVRFDHDFEAVRPGDVLLLLFAMLSVGISEEVVFRGFVLPHLLKKAPSNQNLMVPIAGAALLFGLLHLLNLLQADAKLVVLLSQVTYATLFGMAFGIILLRTESLLPLGLLHGVINFSSNWDKLPGAISPIKTASYMQYEAVISVLVVLPFLWYTLLQLPKIDRDKLYAYLHKIDKG